LYPAAFEDTAQVRLICEVEAALPASPVGAAGTASVVMEIEADCGDVPAAL
jgi:hypothetical protein